MSDLKHLTVEQLETRRASSLEMIKRYTRQNAKDPGGSYGSFLTGEKVRLEWINNYIRGKTMTKQQFIVQSYCHACGSTVHATVEAKDEQQAVYTVDFKHNCPELQAFAKVEKKP